VQSREVESETGGRNAGIIRKNGDGGKEKQRTDLLDSKCLVQ